MYALELLVQEQIMSSTTPNFIYLIITFQCDVWHCLPVMADENWTTLYAEEIMDTSQADISNRHVEKYAGEYFSLPEYSFSDFKETIWEAGEVHGLQMWTVHQLYLEQKNSPNSGHNWTWFFFKRFNSFSWALSRDNFIFHLMIWSSHQFRDFCIHIELWVHLGNFHWLCFFMFLSFCLAVLIITSPSQSFSRSSSKDFS